MSEKETDVRIWSLQLWPFSIHVALTRRPTKGASLVLSLFIWKMGTHIGISAID